MPDEDSGDDHYAEQYQCLVAGDKSSRHLPINVELIEPKANEHLGRKSNSDLFNFVGDFKIYKG